MMIPFQPVGSIQRPPRKTPAAPNKRYPKYTPCSPRPSPRQRSAPKQAGGLRCRNREIREMPCGRFATQKAGGPLCSKREVRYARSGRFALNRAKTSLLAVSTTHMLDLGRSISHYHFPTWAFTRSKKRARVAITLNRECGSRFFADRAQKRDLARISKRTPPSRFALARTRSADPPPLAQHSGEKLAAKPPAAREGVFDPASGAKPQAAGDLESRFLQQGVVEELPFGQWFHPPHDARLGSPRSNVEHDVQRSTGPDTWP